MDDLTEQSRTEALCYTLETWQFPSRSKRTSAPDGDETEAVASPFITSCSTPSSSLCCRVGSPAGQTSWQPVKGRQPAQNLGDTDGRSTLAFNSWS